jgi:CHAD domain-containing protein
MTKTACHPTTLLLGALEERWENYRTQLDRCRAEFSNEAVHDLRVATRRMLAYIQLFNSIAPRPRLKKLKRAFKDQLDEFDDLRDTQVILAELSKFLQELPQLHDFQKHLQLSEERFLRALRKRIKSLRTSDVTKRIRKRVKQRYHAVDIARSATIHRVRVAFKSFRYMVEIVHPMLPGFPPENFKRMNEYQSLMGEIQDAEVFSQILSDFTDHASLSDPEPVRRYEEQRHADALSAYKKSMNNLTTFWREKPDQPFPWEKTE